MDNFRTHFSLRAVTYFTSPLLSLDISSVNSTYVFTNSNQKVGFVTARNMKHPHIVYSFVLTTLFFLISLSHATTTGTGECKPHTWSDEGVSGATAAVAKPYTPKTTPAVPRIDGANIQPGQINCRYWGQTHEDVDSNSCLNLAKYYGIKIEKFFMLNPILDPDCGNIRPDTEYCTAGCE